MQDLRGVTIAQYRILRQLESGGMGIVYKAEDTRLQRMVVLKFLPERSVLDQTAKERFIREARLASALDHPNICTVYEFNKTTDGKLYMVMPYYQGESLAEIIRQGPIEPERVIRLGIQIAEGLACAHAGGIIHRDLKPANILVTQDDQLKILDFGLAKISGETVYGSDSVSSGTAYYMSPEQLLGEKTDAHTDIWSFGILIYEMLNGSPPFTGEYFQTISYSILNDEPPIVQQDDKLRVELNKIILHALQKKRENRYENMQDIIEDLTKINAAKVEIKPQQTETPAEAHKEIPVKKRLLWSVIILTFIITVIILLWPGSDAGETPVLTILPFSEQSDRPVQTHFSDGVVEELILRLARIPDISVRPWEFSRQMKKSALSASEIYRQMGGRYYLSGQVISEDNDIRIEVQLFDAVSERMIWNARFRKSYDQIFVLMDEIIDQVAHAIISGNNTSLQRAYSDQLTPDIISYDYYLRGREKYYQYTSESNKESIDMFKRALEVNPDFPRAKAGLADAYTQMTLRFGADMIWLDSALYRAQSALCGESSDAEAYKAEGLVFYSRSWIHKSIEANQKALQINANYVPAMANLAWSWIHTGELQKALPLLQRAQLLFPTNPSINIGIGFIKLIEGEYSDSEKWLRHAYNLQNDHRPNPLVLLEMLHELQGDTSRIFSDEQITNDDPALLISAGNACLVMGRPACAMENYSATLQIHPDSWHPFTGINVTTSLGFILWKTDRREEAKLMFKYSEEQNNKNIYQGSEWWGVEYDQAALHAIRGETEQSLARLNSATSKGFRMYRWLEIDPLFESLRENPAFLKLLTAVSEKLK